MRSKILLLLLVLAGAALGYWFHQNFEFVEESVDEGWSRKATLNKFLAVEQYLQELSFEVDSSDQLRRLETLPADATLMLADSSMIISERQLQKLLDWLEGGGHLIVGAAYSSEEEGAEEPGDGEASTEPDFLMRHLGLDRFEDKCDCEEGSNSSDQWVEALEQTFGGNVDDDSEGQESGKKLSELLREKNEKLREKKRQLKNTVDQSSNAEITAPSEVVIPDESEEIKQEETYPEDELTATEWEGYEGTMQLYFDSHSKLEHDFFYEATNEEQEGIGDSAQTVRGVEPTYWRGNKHGAQLVQFNWGEGLITVVSQTDIWHSKNLRRLDHALLLWLLVDNTSEVLLLYGTQMPSLGELIWQYAAETVTAALLLLLVWFWRLGRRFGKPLQPIFVERRSMLEHIDACAQLLWRGRHEQALIEPLRRDTRRLLGRKHPALNAASDEEVFTAIAHICSLPENAVARAFNSGIDNSENEFQICVTTLQKIRKAL